MDIEFAEQKHREEVFQLMEMTGMPMNEAYQLLQHANFQIENAIQMHFSKSELVEEHSHEVYPQQFHKQESGDFDENYEKYCAWRMSGERFAQKYHVRREEEPFNNSLVPKMFKAQPEGFFKKKFETFLGRTCPIKYSIKSLTQTLEQDSCANKFPIIVHVIKFVPEIKSKLVEFLCGKNRFADEFFNIQFRSFGLDVDKYSLQESMKPFIDVKNDVNTLVIMRILGKVRMVSATLATIENELKKIKATCIQKQLEEMHFEKRYQQELHGNYDYQKPKSINQRKKIAEDRALRKKQDEEFQAVKKIEELKQKEREKKKEIEIKNYSKKEDNEEKKIVVDVKDVEKRREQLRKSLKTYQEGMMIKLRLPSGDVRRIVVSVEQKVSYLYNFVESESGDCGFQHEQERKFDIIQPFEQLNLSDHLHEPLKEVFPGSDSQNMNVREKE